MLFPGSGKQPAGPPMQDAGMAGAPPKKKAKKRPIPAAAPSMPPRGGIRPMPMGGMGVFPR